MDGFQVAAVLMLYGLSLYSNHRYVKLKRASIELRRAQKAYMANRGDEYLGGLVKRSAEALDQVLGKY